jgi:hypothetical protein
MHKYGSEGVERLFQLPGLTALHMIWESKWKKYWPGIQQPSLYINIIQFSINGAKTECENYMLRHMLPHNYVVLVLLSNPTEIIVKAVKFFRLLFIQVMFTNEWDAVGEKLCFIVRNS